METIVQQLVNGIALGGVFALVAVAFSLVYGIIRLVNFAFGGLLMVGAYVSAFFLGGQIPVFGDVQHGPDFGLVPALVIAMVVCGALGWLTELVAYRPLRARNAPAISMMITSLAVLILLQSLAGLAFEQERLPFPAEGPLGTEAMSFGSILVLPAQLTSVLAAALMAAGLIWLTQRTTFGLQSRACGQDLPAAELQGVDSEKVIIRVFVIGSMLAGLAGPLYAAQTGFLAPSMGFDPGLMAMVAAIVGGIGNIRGAFLGGILVGLITTFGVAYVPGASGFGAGFAFAVLVVVLWLRPSGLFGSGETARPGTIERGLPVVSLRWVRRRLGQHSGARP